MNGEQLDALQQVERSLLGCLLFDASLWQQAEGLYFSLDIHREIYGCMVAMRNKGQVVDTVTLGMELADRNKMDACAYLARLTDQGQSANFSAYVKRVKDGALEIRSQQLSEKLSLATTHSQRLEIADEIRELERGEGSRAGLKITYLSEVKAKPQKYLWEPYIPSDQLISLYGPSHTAKTIIALDFAARVTTGANWPDGSKNTMGPRKVLMLAAGEDAIETVLKPRFVLAGGDPSRLAFIDHVGRCKDDGNFIDDVAALDKDIPEIERYLAQDGEFGMIIIDPITNHLGDKRPNQEEEVRPVLMKLRAVAEKHGIPIWMNGHFNKRDRGTAALDKVLGCRAFVGVPRTIYMTGTDNKAEADEKFSYVFAQERGRGAKAWKYKTRMTEGIVDGAAIKEVTLSWEGETDATGQDVVDTLSRDEKRTERDIADQLTAYLESNGGTAPQEDCKKALDYPKVNWKRVRDKVGVQSVVNSGGGGKGGRTALWTLGSENTTTASRTVTLCHSDSTYKNIETYPIVFSGTSPKVHSENTSENTQRPHSVLSESVPSAKAFDCPDCGAHFDTSAGWAKHAVGGCK